MSPNLFFVHDNIKVFLTLTKFQLIIHLFSTYKNYRYLNP